MIEISIIIPLSDNSGKRFTSAHHEAFEAQLLQLFGGFSRQPGTVHGGWMDEGVTYKDTSRVYSVAVESITEGAKVGALADQAKRHYQQLAVYVRYLGLAEIL